MCSIHHTRIHNNNWTIELGPNREFTLRLPDGTIHISARQVLRESLGSGSISFQLHQESSSTVWSGGIGKNGVGNGGEVIDEFVTIEPVELAQVEADLGRP